MKKHKLDYEAIVNQLVSELGIALKVNSEQEHTLPFILWEVRELVSIKEKSGFTNDKYIDLLERVADKQPNTNAKKIDGGVF